MNLIVLISDINKYCKKMEKKSTSIILFILNIHH